MVPALVHYGDYSSKLSNRVIEHSFDTPVAHAEIPVIIPYAVIE